MSWFTESIEKNLVCRMRSLEVLILMTSYAKRQLGQKSEDNNAYFVESKVKLFHYHGNWCYPPHAVKL